MKKVTLFLMTEKGEAVLRHLLQKGFSGMIAEVIVGKDEAVGEDASGMMITLAQAAGLKHSLREDRGPVDFTYALAVSWRWMISATGGASLWVLHDSLLPKYRGFAPLVSQLVNKERMIGVTAIFGNDNYDTGNVIASRSTGVQYPLRIKEAIGLLKPLYAELAEELFSIHASGNVFPSIPQDDKEATYSLWRDEEDYRIDWSRDAAFLRRFIDATGSPYSGASCFLGNEKVRILAAEEAGDVPVENRDAGKVIFMKDQKPVVVCGKGLLRILEAVYEKDRRSIFPLPAFRLRFK